MAFDGIQSEPRSTQQLAPIVHLLGNANKQRDNTTMNINASLLHSRWRFNGFQCFVDLCMPLRCWRRTEVTAFDGSSINSIVTNCYVLLPVVTYILNKRQLVSLILSWIFLKTTSKEYSPLHSIGLRTQKPTCMQTSCIFK